MSLSRRKFLVGAGATVVTAGAAFAVADGADHSLVERGLHRVGLASSPNRSFPPSGATEQSGTLRSRYMAAKVGWTISRPGGSGPARGIVYCLHGYHSDHRMAFNQIDVPAAAALVGLRVIVAGVDGGADSYWHKRLDGTDPLAMLINEFIPLVRKLTGDLPQAVMGWSMGGYGALLAAERARSSFVGVAPASPALWLTPGSSAAGAFDGPADFYANDVFTDLNQLNGLVVAVACGTGDPFYNSTKTLVAKMDFPHAAVYGEGFHDDAYWRSVAPGQLQAFSNVF